MFSAFVLLVLYIAALLFVYYLIGRLGLFKKVGKILLNTKKNFIDDKENE